MQLFATTHLEQHEVTYPRRWWALAALCLSLLLVVIANTLLVVTAPAMTMDMHLSSSQLQWVIDGYTVPYAALLSWRGARRPVIAALTPTPAASGSVRIPVASAS